MVVKYSTIKHFNFSLRETISINTSPGSCVSYITDIQLFSFSFVLLFDYSSCPTMSCLTFTRSLYVFFLFFYDFEQLTTTLNFPRE